MDNDNKKEITDFDIQEHVVNAPFEAYEGDKPYIFISYKHADWKIVYPVIKKLHNAGFNIWYDANLEKGKYYDIQIANHIKKSALFVTFITQTVIDSSSDEEDYLIKELNVAKETKRKRLPIYLENVELDGFYLMNYSGKQSILKHEYSNNEDMFIEACVATFKSFGLEPKKVKDYMTQDVIVVSPDMSIQELKALIKVTKHDIFPVEKYNEIVGLITASDILKRDVTPTVKGMMSKDIVIDNNELSIRDVKFVTPDMSISELKEIIKITGQDVFPVVKDNKVVGMITGLDILKID